MTRIEPLFQLTARQLRRRDIAATLATLAMVASLSYLWHTASVQADEQPDAIMERIMLAACRLPDTEGAYTWFRRIDGRFECGRYR